MLFFLSLIETEEKRDALEKIYHEHLDWMLKIAFYFLKNKEDAEDAIQDVFVSLVKNKADIPYGDENSLQAYLFICIRNATSRLSKQKKKQKFESLFNNFPSYDDMQDNIIKKDFYAQVLSFIKTFPPKYKDVLVLNIVYEKNSKEIAEILNISKKTIETRLRRGKKIINSKFEEFDI